MVRLLLIIITRLLNKHLVWVCDLKTSERAAEVNPSLFASSHPLPLIGITSIEGEAHLHARGIQQLASRKSFNNMRVKELTDELKPSSQISTQC